MQDGELPAAGSQMERSFLAVKGDYLSECQDGQC